tara:strand:+ start:1719 stop:1994 length:276 start_codon:yes stop_codon:yes gene_type:complete
MQKTMYLFVIIGIFVFSACGNGENTEAQNNAPGVEEIVNEEALTTCSDDCQKACCLGCKATKGDKKCIVLEDGSMPCCIIELDSEDHGHSH